MKQVLDSDLAQRAAERLGVVGVSNDADGVASFYAAWCRDVPFDNLRKLVGLRRDVRPLPGDDPNDFFDAWLEHGSGATCWASANAMYALARFLEFDVARVAGSMFDLPDLNHGSVVVTCDEKTWLLDSSLLTGTPLLLTAASDASEHCGYRVRIAADGETWMLHADSVHAAELPCRLYPGARSADEFSARHENTRTASVFNTVPHVLRHRPGAVDCLHDHEVTSWTPGGRSKAELSDAERAEWLSDVGRFSPELIAAAQ